MFDTFLQDLKIVEIRYEIPQLKSQQNLKKNLQVSTKKKMNMDMVHACLVVNGRSKSALPLSISNWLLVKHGSHTVTGFDKSLNGALL